MTTEELREELQRCRGRQHEAVDTLAELSYLIYGIELIDRFEDDNGLKLPDNLREINACDSLKEAAYKQIRSTITAIETLLLP